MKRILFLMAAMTVMFASCQKNFDDGSSIRTDASEIRLKLNVKSPTKAFTESKAAELETNGFKVAAVKADNSVLFNDAVAYNTADGTFSVPDKHYFFPADGSKMSFYAVYPAQEITVNNTDGTATITYSQNADTDLIAAKAETVASTSGPVLMTFSHLLSQVSVKAQGIDPDYSYKLKSVKITDAEGGIYAFANDTWTPSGTPPDYELFTSDAAEGTELRCDSLLAVSDTMTFIPGAVKIKAVWSAQKGTEVLIDNNVEVDVNLAQGKSITLNLFLPADANNAAERDEEIFFNIVVGDWNDSDVIMKKYVPELLPELFTVNSSDKKVKFTKGNLYWNGSEFINLEGDNSAFRCEAHQYDYPTVWAVNHVGHFYWSKTASIAYAKDYSDADAATGDTFFAADNGVFEGFTVLDKDEWQYLINNALVKASSDKPKVVTIDGKKCVILKPDSFRGGDADIYDNYTAEEWATAEAAGLVALPFAGYRLGASFSRADSYGNFWSCTPSSDLAGDAWCAYFYADGAYMVDDLRYGGRCVRLVSVQNSL